MNHSDMNLTVVMERTADLVPYAHNAKVHDEHQIEQICASIEEFGFADPIGVWTNESGDSEIVEGHGRVLAAQRLGIDEVPVIHLDALTDEQRRAYALVHNQLTMATGWDADALGLELDELAGDFDMGNFGFDPESVFGADVYAGSEPVSYVGNGDGAQEDPGSEILLDDLSGSYGLPYLGSKSVMIDFIMSHIPTADTFVDIFAGGCSVTHAALVSSRFGSVISNDITRTSEVFRGVSAGELDYARVVSRDEFGAIDAFNGSLQDRLTKLIWSFNSNCVNYCLSKESGNVGTSIVSMILSDDINSSYDAYRKLMSAISELSGYGDSTVVRIITMSTVSALIGKILRIKNIVGAVDVSSLQVSSVDYRDVYVPANAIVYADPPYRSVLGTMQSYDNASFSVDDFDAWLAEVDFPVIISEYDCPPGCVEVASFETTTGAGNVPKCRSGQSSRSHRVEKMFVQERFADLYDDMMAASSIGSL